MYIIWRIYHKIGFSMNCHKKPYKTYQATLSKLFVCMEWIHTKAFIPYLSTDFITLLIFAVIECKLSF